MFNSQFPGSTSRGTPYPRLTPWLHSAGPPGLKLSPTLNCTAILATPHGSHPCYGRIIPFMVLALLTSALLSIVCFIATLLMGFMVFNTTLAQHVLFGLFTTFLVTLTQSMTMFYFIGTGKQVKDLVASLPTGPELVQRTKVFKAKVFPPALWAMLFTMATMIIGGGVHTHVAWTPPLLHALLAAASLYYNIIAFWKEAKYMIENNLLLAEVDRLLQ